VSNGGIYGSDARARTFAGAAAVDEWTRTARTGSVAHHPVKRCPSGRPDPVAHQNPRYETLARRPEAS
jgi:hypothetical protein